MNILIIDIDSAMTDFSLRASLQGHDVRHWMQIVDKHGPILNGKGMLHKVRSWEPHMKWADLIVRGTNNCKLVHALEYYWRRGYPLFGAPKAGLEWESNRARGQEILAAAGVPVMDSIPFTSYKKAAAFVAGGKTRYVAKPNGEVDKALSYVSKGAEDLQFMLEHWSRTMPQTEFILQEFVPGIEFAVGGFFGPGGWCGPWLENFEHKKLMAGDVGPNTGEMGTVMKYVGDSKLADEVLRPLEGELYRVGYAGYIDVSVIVDARGRAWPLEFTSRLGHPLWMIQQVLHPDIADWMGNLVQGKDTFKPTYEVAVGVSVGLKDFPYDIRPHEEASGFPIFGWDKPRLGKYLHPDDIMMGEVLGKPAWVSCGPMPITVSGTADTVAAAADKAYEHLGELIIPNSPMYRNDIGRGKLREKLRTLQGFGYAKEWRYG